jgi:hypothetical protein
MKRTAKLFDGLTIILLIFIALLAALGVLS